MDPRLYFRQLLAGRDTARNDVMARQMVNFQYLIGDKETGEAVIVDPAYDVDGLFDILEADGMRCAGVLVTHYHPDHIGGDFMGHNVVGLADVLAKASVPVHVQDDEAAGVARVTGVSVTDLVRHDGGDTVTVGQVPIELLHTPGHTPGSQCFFVDGHLVAGDTLFLEGCGRVDLPGGDPEALYFSITQTLAKVPDETILFPGHLYAPDPSAPLGEVRRSNYVYRFKTLDQWKIMFGS
jgi:glyoxylase-like metal-dependent hydrolase (beta-lactamase superfamily II)